MDINEMMKTLSRATDKNVAVNSIATVLVELMNQEPLFALAVILASNEYNR